MTKVSVIIPAYNEAQSIVHVVKKIKSFNPDFEIIVIDDGSTDDTAAVSRDAGAKVFSHPYNIGNGAAVKSGIRIASGNILVFMDGDGQHDPDDIAKLLEHFSEFDMVVGARSKADHASLGRTFGNTAYNWLASYVAKFRVEDLTSGFRAVKADIAHNLLYLLPNTYSYPTTLTLSVLRNGRPVKYVPIKAKTRKSGKSGISMYQRRRPFFYDYRKDLHPVFPFQDISSGKFCYVSDRFVLLPLYILYVGPLYQHERPFIYHLHSHIHDWACVGADLPDEA